MTFVKLKKKIKPPTLDWDTVFKERNELIAQYWNEGNVGDRTIELEMSYELIDVFNFSHEPIELLEMRLRIVYPHVDLICINENAVTYTGIEREMQFEKYKERLDHSWTRLFIVSLMFVREILVTGRTLNRNITPTGGRFIHVQRLPHSPREMRNGQCMDVIV